MEKMPYRQELDLHVSLQASVAQPEVGNAISTDWREGLPVLSGKRVTLRELRASDAPSLFALLTTEEVSRFISPPPTTVEGFERFIAWTIRQRRRDLRLFRRHARRHGHGDRDLPAPRAGSRVRHGGVGIRDRVALLGDRRVQGRS